MADEDSDRTLEIMARTVIRGDPTIISNNFEGLFHLIVPMECKYLGQFQVWSKKSYEDSDDC